MSPTLKFKAVDKDRIFYDRYRYCISFNLEEISCLRELDHDYIDTIIARRRMWRDASKQRWSALHTGKIMSSGVPTISSTKIHPARTILAPRHNSITDKMVDNLHELANLLIKTSSEFKIVTSVNSGWVYTNSLSLLKKLNELACLKNKFFTEAVVTRPKNTILLENPNHTHRSYFKTVKLTPEEKQNLTNFLNNQRDYMRASPSLITWIEQPYHRLQDYFFIDHTGESWLVMLALINPRLVRKTMDIISR
jgi:hypothetical protein